MKKSLLLLTALWFSLTFKAQHSETKSPCGTYNAMDDHFKKDPASLLRYETVQRILKTQSDELTKNVARTAAVQYTIPVVFHVLHTGGPENVSDALLINAINQVNMDYAASSLDANTVAVPFQSLYINSDIKFMLAKKDPNGNCTTGITRRYDTRTDWSSTQTSYSGITWDPTKYLNIIVVKVINGGQLIGYTYLPGTWNIGDGADCIVYDGGFLSSLDDIRSMSHEIGHWFNLPHTFGNTNDPGLACGDDGIADTPPTMGTFGCPSSLSGNTCNGGGTDNVENIMNYSNCPKNFTADQTNVMRTAAASGLVGRSNLWSAANLSLTGIASTVPCAPICDFYSASNSYTVCSGASLFFKDFSYNGVITSYSWSATNANVAAPTASNTNITFPSAGTSIVTLIVSNLQGISSLSKTVTILNGSVTVAPNYGESFEGAGLPSGWTITNPNIGSVTWEQTDMGASQGKKSYFIEGANNIANHWDYLNLPVLDVLNNPNNLFTFKYAYARQSGANNDLLKVQASLDCGGTWLDILQLTAGVMCNGSGGVDANPFVPQVAQWKTYDLTAHPNWFQVQNSSNVQLRFAFQEDVGGIGFGNRLYLDEVFFADPNGLKEKGVSTEFVLMPNPSNGNATLKFTLNHDAEVKYTMLDVSGRLVEEGVTNYLNLGAHEIILNSSKTLSKGIYFVNLSVNGSVNIKKLIIH